MAVAVRVIPCLDVDAGRVVKGVNFQNLRDAGDPVEMAAVYDAEGADELTFLDVTASSGGRETMMDVVRRTAEQVFIPLTVGGGIRTSDDVDRLLRAGADKVSVNTAAIVRPELLGEMARRFGSQCIVLSVDARTVPAEAQPTPSGWEVTTHGGRRGPLRARGACRSGRRARGQRLPLRRAPHQAGQERAARRGSRGAVTRVESALDPAIAARLKRTPDGLVCAVVQEHSTREVLMIAWMDDEALHRTLTTGRATYWSRSRGTYWVKGETSGHRQWVRDVRLDCDGDALLVTVDQEG